MSMFAALQSLGTELALVSMRRARIDQGRAKLASAVPPKLPGVGNPTAPARLGKSQDLQIVATTVGSKPPKLPKLASALNDVLGNKEI